MHGGYDEGEIAVCRPHRQNPHMHLLECFVAFHAATGRRAGAAVRSILRRFALARSSLTSVTATPCRTQIPLAWNNDDDMS